MKLIVLAAVIGLVPAAAQAQVAAGSVPNSFDQPAQAAQAAPEARPAPTVPPVADPANPQSEEVLRTIIANAQSGTIDYSLMKPNLVAAMREQEATIVPLIRGFGAIVAVDFMGTQEGADLFVVTFANAATQWIIGFDDTGKVDALRFRPAG